MKSVKIRSFFWTVFSRIRTRKKPFSDTFHAVSSLMICMEEIVLKRKKNKYFFSQSMGVLTKRCSENCSKFTGEHPGQSVISIKLQSKFIEITLWHGCSPINLLHIFKKLQKKKNSNRGLSLIYSIDKEKRNKGINLIFRWAIGLVKYQFLPRKPLFEKLYLR